MKTLLLILGPTAVGKTSFALKLAEQALAFASNNDPGSEELFSGVDLISADSRQVYKDLEVLSGADLPSNLPDSIKLHGVSILDLTDEWSVAHFKNFAIKIIKNSFANNRLPIIVGGTNLYIKHLFNLDDNLYVKPIDEIRKKAKNMSVAELQNWLKSIAPDKIAEMNNSDVNNPRRLVRAIEIVLGKPESEEILNLPKEIRTIKIGLVADSDKDANLDKISERIKKRVVERFENGAIEEVKKLNEFCSKKELGVASSHKFTSVSTLGVSEISSYLKKEIDKVNALGHQKKCLEDWALHEFQYAKRQLVWLKKEEDIIWLDDSTKSRYTLDSKLFKE